MKMFFSLLPVILFSVISAAQSSGKSLCRDFNRLAGAWKGSLTYLDYSSGKPYTMQADIDIRRIGKSGLFIFSNSYPKEPQANSVDTLEITADGKLIDGEQVVSRKKEKDGSLVIITEIPGRDGNDNKEALIRHTYTISRTRFTLRKEVRFAGETNWIKRHEYSYTR